MKIKHTDAETTFPWPEGTSIQGGGLYRTPFIEVAPAGKTFIRGEGETLADAEKAAWKKYQIWINCDGSGPHGPWEARGRQNGSGFCTRCGTWGSEVLEPSDKFKAEALACTAVIERYGDGIILHRSWRDLVEEETAIILNDMVGDSSMPMVRTVTPPTEEEMAAIRKEEEEPLDLSILGDLLQAIVDAPGPATDVEQKVQWGVRYSSQVLLADDRENALEIIDRNGGSLVNIIDVTDTTNKES